TRPLAEFQERGGRPKRRRSSWRQQQTRHADVADRARDEGSGCWLHSEFSRLSYRLADGGTGVSAGRGQNLPQLDEQHPRRSHGRPQRPQGLARRCRVQVVEFVASLARTRRRLQPERSEKHRRQRLVLLLRRELAGAVRGDASLRRLPAAQARAASARSALLPAVVLERKSQRGFLTPEFLCPRSPGRVSTNGTKSYSPIPCRTRNTADASPALVTRCGRFGGTE